MLGAIAGDIIGSAFESHPIKSTSFPLFSSRCAFTDDTVLTVAVAHCLLSGWNYKDAFKYYGNLYPLAGYGQFFRKWLRSPDSSPYSSFGNGSAMRVSPIGFAFDEIDEVLKEAKKSAEVTHNHPEGIKGAQVIAAAVFLARKGCSKKQIKSFIEELSGYNLNITLDEIRPAYRFDSTCQGSVPHAVRAFLESEDFEDAIRKAISLGGDSDTLACMAGAIAHAFYGEVPRYIVKEVKKRLDKPLLEVVEEFNLRYDLQKI